MYVVVRDSVVESFGIIAGRIGRNVLLVVTLSSTFFLSFCEFRFYSTRGVIFLTLVARMLLPSVLFSSFLFRSFSLSSHVEWNFFH